MELVIYFGFFIAYVSIVLLYCWFSNKNSVVSNWPVVGMIPSLLYNALRIHDFVTEFLHQSNGTFLFKGPWFCAMDFIITSDPMNVHHTFSKNFSNYPKGPELHEIIEPLLGDGIFNVDSNSWRIQRNMIHSLFNDKRFSSAVRSSIHEKISKGLFSVLDHASKLGYEVDMQDIFQRFNFDNICVVVFGMDPNTLSIEFPRVPFGKAFDDIGEVVYYRHIMPQFIWKLQRWLQIGEEKKMTKACNTFDHLVKQFIQRKQQQLETNTTYNVQFDVLTYFLQMRDDNQETRKLSDKFIRDMALNLMFAGRDTTSAALAWTFWLIWTNPSVETYILKEMEQHFGSNNDNKWSFFDFEKLKKLVYLHGVICEVLRLYPPVPFEHKVSIEQDVLPSGHYIPRNTKIFYSLYSMGRMKALWGEDCLEFKPERWILKSGRNKHYPSYKFIAFNSGPRTCLGKDLALLQMKAIVCGILWNYYVQLIEDQHICPSTSSILHQKNGLKVRVYKRN